MLNKIMTKRNLTKSQVMDELGLKRLDPSIWMSVAQGWKVSSERLARFERWLAANKDV